ncbi:MAG: PAS domain-containing protein [Pseudomonadota bacterium]
MTPLTLTVMILTIGTTALIGFIAGYAPRGFMRPAKPRRLAPPAPTTSPPNTSLANPPTAALQTALMAVPNGLMTFDETMAVTFANPAALELWHLTKAPLSWPHLLDDLHHRRHLPEESDWPAFRQDLLSLWQETGEMILHLPDERIIKLAMHIDPAGGRVALFEDQSHTSRIERQYHTSLQVYTHSLDQLFEAICVIAEDGHITLMNRAFRQLWGMPPPAPEDTVRDVLRHINARVRTPPPLSGEPGARTLITRDSRTLDHETITLPDGGRLLSFIDRTAHHQVRRALADAKAARKVSEQIKNTLLQSLAYDIHTPLTTILGYLDLIARTPGHPLPPPLDRYLDSARQAADDLAQLSQNTLLVTDFETGLMNAQPQQITLAPLVAQIEQSHRRQLEEKKLTLHFRVSLADESPDDRADALHDIAFYTDVRLMHGVLYHLTGEAIRRMAPGRGGIRLTLSETSLPASRAMPDAPGPSGQEPGLQIRLTFPRARRREPGINLLLAQRLVHALGGTLIESSPLSRASSGPLSGSLSGPLSDKHPGQEHLLEQQGISSFIVTLPNATPPSMAPDRQS